MPRLARHTMLPAPSPLAGLCRRCRLERRAFASAPVPKPPSSGVAHLTSRRLLSVAGPDALRFLQGIVTANVAPDDPRTGCYAGFLNATGRLLHDVFLYHDVHGLGAEGGRGEAFLVEVDAGQADRLARYIKRYKLRAKVDLRALAPDEVTVWQAWDDGDDNDAAGLDGRARGARGGPHVLRDPRAPGLGCRVLQRGGQAPAVGLETSTQDAYTIRRYLAGVPEGPDELVPEAALPQESNMDVMNGIAYHKGCYVGQELTIRTKHRGVVRKRVLPCALYESHAPAPATLRYAPEAAAEEAGPEARTLAESIPAGTGIGRVGKRGRSAGKWLKGVGNIGLGLCRLEIMTDVALPGEAAAAGGFSAEDEFVLPLGEDKSEGVKVKAFVPAWLRAALKAQQ